MKKSILKTIALLTSFAIIACSQDIVVENTQNRNDGDAINKICITGKDFQIDDDTRSSVTIGESGASFAWDEDDVIGIFPDKGDQVSFAMEQGAGTQTATFTGGGWALKSSSKYAAYYPHVYENRDLTKIPVSYVGQTQNGNGNTDHIGAYDFMAAGVSTPENGAVAFDMQHLGALVQLTITVPEPSTLTKVVLTSSTEFTEIGTIDLTAEIPAITAVTQSNTLEIALNNVTTTEANEKVIVYFMMAPVDLTDSELTATTYYVNETSSEIELTKNNLQPGKAYRFTEDVKSLNDYIDEYGINHGEGVEIDGVVWAPVNCGYHKDDYKYGKLYQWGRKYGQGYCLSYADGEWYQSYSDASVPEIVQGPVSLMVGQSEENATKFYYAYSPYDWLSKYNDELWDSSEDSNPVKTEYDPCPEGWRVPTFYEICDLYDNYSELTTDKSGQEGRWFSGSQQFSSSISKVFLPAGGRNKENGISEGRGSVGYYWMSTPLYDRFAYYFYFDDINVKTAMAQRRACGYSVRCVKE